jgi:hypothetical protein
MRRGSALLACYPDQQARSVMFRIQPIPSLAAATQAQEGMASHECSWPDH